MKENLRLEKITEKIEEEVKVRGQGCWDDCEIWKNNITAGKNKCRRDFTAYNNPFK